jgi:hypothetical protein
MTWEAIRQQYPHRWLLVEAIDAYTEGTKQVVQDLLLIDVFGSEVDDNTWDHYICIRQPNMAREYYLFHTDNETLDIGAL